MFFKGKKVIIEQLLLSTSQPDSIITIVSGGGKNFYLRGNHLTKFELLLTPLTVLLRGYNRVL